MQERICLRAEHGRRGSNAASRINGAMTSKQNRSTEQETDIEVASDLSPCAEALERGLRAERRGDLDRAVECFEEAAECADRPGLRAEALRRLAIVHCNRCEWARAIGAARESAEAAREARMVDAIAEAQNVEGMIYLHRGDFDAAVQCFEKSLTLARDDRARGNALQNMGAVAAQRGDLEEAEECFLQSAQLFCNAGYARGEVVALTNYAAAALDRHEPARAEAISQRAVDAAKALGDLDLLGTATLNLAEAVATQERLPEAEELASSALGYFSTSENPRRRIECFRLLGEIHRRRGEIATARECLERGLRAARQADSPVDVARLGEALRALPPDRPSGERAISPKAPVLADRPAPDTADRHSPRPSAPSDREASGR